MQQQSLDLRSPPTTRPPLETKHAQTLHANGNPSCSHELTRTCRLPSISRSNSKQQICRSSCTRSSLTPAAAYASAITNRSCSYVYQLAVSIQSAASTLKHTYMHTSLRQGNATTTSCFLLSWVPSYHSHRLERLSIHKALHAMPMLRGFLLLDSAHTTYILTCFYIHSTCNWRQRLTTRYKSM